MKEIKIYTVDAFTNKTFYGNPAGVVVMENYLSDELMQLIARETNLSETAFLNKDKIGHYNVRYFTPSKEIDFCGHATLASSWILLTEYDEINQVDELVFKTNIGEVTLRWEKENNELQSVMMTQVEPKIKDIEDDVQEIISLIGINQEDLDTRYQIKLAYTGNWHLLIPIKSKEAVDCATPDFKRLKEHNLKNKLSTTHLFTFDTKQDEVLLYTRDFAPSVGIEEDPVTGSANGALAGYLVLEGIINENSSFKIIQTNTLQRLGELVVKTLRFENKLKIQVGGRAVKVLSGHMTIR